MSGDQRARHCESCKLNVYNIAGMTNAEVEHLVSNREGRLCIRLFRRADGTILTKDCPIGFRAYQKRIARFAGATLSVLFSLVGFSAAQGTGSTKDVQNSEENEQKLSSNELSGIVVDSAGAVIPGAKIRIFKNDDKKPLRKTRSYDDGRYSFTSLSVGKYRLEVKFEGFTTEIFNDIEIVDGANTTLNIEMEPAPVTVVVGMIAETALIDTNSSSANFTH